MKRTKVALGAWASDELADVARAAQDFIGTPLHTAFVQLLQFEEEKHLRTLRSIDAHESALRVAQGCSMATEYAKMAFETLVDKATRRLNKKEKDA